ncbi:MAG TPA: 2'-deoxycytidine 5'-triphosphate deaminase, partial [Hyphomonas atlantica]|nr:2'-deoxycytidine 5'-triphosphate deaminase [Hyphomonas atlantica]
LAQIRFKRKKPETLKEKIVSIDLEVKGDQPVGWRAKHHSGIVDLRGLAAHEASQFWEPVWPRDGRIVLNPEEFY